MDDFLHLNHKCILGMGWRAFRQIPPKDISSSASYDFKRFCQSWYLHFNAVNAKNFAICLTNKASTSSFIWFLALNFVYIEQHCLPVKVQDKEVDFWHLSFKIMEIILFTPGLPPGIRLSFCWRQLTYALMSIWVALFEKKYYFWDYNM